jgi:hypothetical protein
MWEVISDAKSDTVFDSIAKDSIFLRAGAFAKSADCAVPASFSSIADQRGRDSDCARAYFSGRLLKSERKFQI